MKLKSHTDMASRYITAVIEGLKVAFPGRASAFGTSFNHFATAFVKNLCLDLRLKFIKHQSASADHHSSVRFDPLSHTARCADEASIGQRISIDLQAALDAFLVSTPEISDPGSVGTSAVAIREERELAVILSSTLRPYFRMIERDGIFLD